MFFLYDSPYYIKHLGINNYTEWTQIIEILFKDTSVVKF